MSETVDPAMLQSVIERLFVLAAQDWRRLSEALVYRPTPDSRSALDYLVLGQYGQAHQAAARVLRPAGVRYPLDPRGRTVEIGDQEER